MRIAFNAWFNESPHTGSGQYARHLLAALGSLAPDLEIELVAPRSRGDLAKVQFEQVTFPQAARRMEADVALVPYWAPPLRCAAPVVTTIHDVIPLALPEYRGGPLQRAYTSLVRAATPGASRILTDSEFSKRDILARLPVAPAAVAVVPLAADARFTPAQAGQAIDSARQRYNLPDTFVLYLGGLDRRKNIETLLQVYTWCGDTIGADLPLVIAAAPDATAYTADGRAMPLGDMARALQVDDVVRFAGRIDEADKPAVYQAARCFLLASTYEGFGLPALEAMACGTPVVGSNASSIPEVVGDAGILVDPFDARRMAGALIAVCTDDALHQQLSQRSVLQAARFSWQRTAFETLAVLRQVAEADKALKR